MRSLPWLMAIQAYLFWEMGLYRGIWRFASLPDLWRIIKAIGLGLALSALFLFLVNRLAQVPRAIFPIYGLLLLTLLGGSRFVYRWLKDSKGMRVEGKRVLIVGGDYAGENLARVLLRGRTDDYVPAGFIAEEPGVQGKDIHGIPVLGRREDIPRVVVERSIESIIIAQAPESPVEMQELVALCERTGVPVCLLPSLADLVDGAESAPVTLRRIAVEDLLGRDPVQLNWERIRGAVAGRTVLVSGGGGSIGSELCLQIAELKPAALVVIDISEFNLYELQEVVSQRHPNLALHARLVDVGDRPAVNQVLREFHPEVVFHAAAYKHVPMLENQVRSAVKNNVLGTRILADAAHEAGVRCFVLISTDKAVNPTNIMGMTKRVAEVYCQYMNAHSKTRYITVRFGNVLGSAGSVVPLFKKQIEAGGPVTVTHPEISRYFMTIPEAAQLILQSYAMGQGGEIFVLDMGQPVKISYLAEMMVRMAGKIPGRDIELAYTGLRPGEKLHEELFHEHEQLLETDCRKIFRANHREAQGLALHAVLDQLQQACQTCDDARMCGLLIQLVPEFRSGDLGLPGKVVPFVSGQRKGANQPS